MSKKKVGKGSKITKIMKAPIRALIKLRDLYIKSMTECSGQFDYATVMVCPGAQVPALPLSFSASSSTRSSNGSDDYRELVKAALTKSFGNKIELDFITKQQQNGGRKSPVTASPNKFPRSQSVGIGRIDEDKTCEFEKYVKVRTDVYPRSRSYAVPNRKMF